MPIADKRYAESSARSRLLELVRQTKRYSICEIKTDQFEVIDDRYLLNRSCSSLSLGDDNDSSKSNSMRRWRP